LLKLAQVSVYGRKSHGIGAVLQGAMKLLTAHFIATATQFFQKLLLPECGLALIDRHGRARSFALLAQRSWQEDCF